MNYGIVKPVLIAFFVSVLLSPMMIRYLHKLKFGQFIRGEGPESHLKKSGTPTMGGLIILLGIVLIDEPHGTYYGGTIAAPVMRSVFQTALPYMGIYKEYTPDKKEP